jgi:hypothetical protein
MTPQSTEVSSLFDSVADLLPAHLREHFYRRMAHFRQLAPNDEILHLAEAMGFLALVIRETPSLIADERQRFDALLTASVHSVRDTFDAARAYHHLLEARLQQLPDEIQAGIDPELISTKITETLRQQFAQTGLPALAQEIAIHTSALTAASKQLSSSVLQFSDPNTGASKRLHTALSSMQTDLNNAADHVRSLTRTLRQELFTALAVLSLGAATIGFFLGIVYAHLR